METANSQDLFYGFQHFFVTKGKNRFTSFSHPFCFKEAGIFLKFLLKLSV